MTAQDAIKRVSETYGKNTPENTWLRVELAPKLARALEVAINKIKEVPDSACANCEGKGFYENTVGHTDKGYFYAVEDCPCCGATDTLNEINQIFEEEKRDRSRRD